MENRLIIVTIDSIGRAADGGGGALNFFSGGGVQAEFPKCGACELSDFCLWKRDLVNWNFQILGL